MYIVRDYQKRIEGFICSRTRRAFNWTWVLLLTALAALGVVFFWMGAPPTNAHPKDIPLFLDGAWRLVNGQTPHKDFYVYFGDLPFYVTWLGMKLGRPGVSAITYGNVFVMVTAGLAAMFVARRRTSAFYALMFSLFIAFLAVAPRALGEPYDCTGYAMVYNRYGEAFLALLGAVLFLPTDPSLQRGWADWVEAGFAGLCLAALVFCKVNYFAVGAGFFVVACLRDRFPLRQALVGFLSAAAFFALALALTKIPLSAMRHDYQIMAAAQSVGDRLYALANHTAKKTVADLPVLLLLVWEISRKQNGPRAAWPHFLVMSIFLGGGILLLSSNNQGGEMPLLAVAALYGAEIIRRQTGQTAEDGFFTAVRNLGAALLFLFFLLPTLGTDFKTMRYVTRCVAGGRWISTETLQSTRLDDFRFVAKGTRLAEMQNFMAWTDEGVQLLRRHANPQMRLAVFMFCNPFQVALGLPPPAGGAICWDNHIGFSRRSHAPLTRMVGKATHILTDRGCADIKEAYGAEWDALKLEVVEETKDFTLFKVPESNANKP